jgi:hypothetical protein
MKSEAGVGNTYTGRKQDAGHDPVLGFSMMGTAPFLALALALGWPSGPKSTRIRRYPSGGLRFLRQKVSPVAQ